MIFLLQYIDRTAAGTKGQEREYYGKVRMKNELRSAEKRYGEL